MDDSSTCDWWTISVPTSLSFFQQLVVGILGLGVQWDITIKENVLEIYVEKHFKEYIDYKHFSLDIDEW